MLSRRQHLRETVLNRLRREFVAGIQNEETLDASDDAPVAAHIDLALIAGMKPAIAQDFRRFFWTLPVTGKNVWAPDNYFIVVRKLHFDAGNGGADVAGLHWNAGIIEGAERGRFG